METMRGENHAIVAATLSGPFPGHYRYATYDSKTKPRIGTVRTGSQISSVLQPTHALHSIYTAAHSSESRHTGTSK